MTELHQALGLETVVQWEGRSIKIGPVTVEVVARWEDWLATENLERLRRIGGNDDKALRVVADQAAEGVFDFYGATSAKRMGELSGLKQLTYFMALQHDGGISKATTDAIVEKDFETMLQSIKKDMAATDALLPNDEAPAATGDKTNAHTGGPC